ncbi:MAG: SGNH/GDSL hydrolase family protein [Actinomycetota bacterium]
MGRKLLALLFGAVLVLSGCASSSEPVETGERESAAAQEAPTYVAIGASETVGIGADDRRTEGWTSVLAQRVLPAEADYVNLGISGATVTEALQQELPKARQAEPDLVTVWLNANDVLSGKPVDRYRDELTRLLEALAETDAVVLVANTPPLSELPAMLACQPDPPRNGPPCLFGADWPPPNLLTRQIDLYNRAIREVARGTGAIVVDLYAAAQVRDETKLLSIDGFHPNSKGHRAVAMQFVKTLKRNDISFD